jgi:hypothetical protein
MSQHQNKILSSLLVHIGYHKTGTTWLQKELFNPESEFFVPLYPGNNPKAGRNLRKLFVRDKERYLLSPFELNKAEILEELDAMLGAIDLGGKIPVLSYERLSGNPHSGGFDARVIADRIKACFPDAKIFCVIREQKDMILSTYFQYLKIGGTDSLTNYLTRSYDGRRPGFSPIQLNYVNLVSCYFRLFSPENVLVLPYEMFRDNAELYLKKLGEFVSVDLSGVSANVTTVHNKRAANSTTPRFPFLNLFLNRSSVNAYSRLYMPMSKPLIHMVSRLTGTGSRARVGKLKQQIDEIIQDRYESSNRELSGMTGLDLSVYGYHG